MQPFSLSSLVFFGLVASVGLTAIIVDGKVFQPLRAWLLRHGETNPVCRFFANIVTCYQHCGFWSGIFCGAFFVLIAAHGQAVMLGKIAMYSMQQSGASLMQEIPPAAVAVFPNWISVVAFAGIVFSCGLIGSLLALSYLILVEFIHSHTLRPQVLPNNEHSGHEE